MRIKVSDSCPGKEAEHIDVMILCSEGKRVLRTEGSGTVDSTLTHEKGLLDCAILGIEHLDEAIEGSSDDSLLLRFFIKHYSH